MDRRYLSHMNGTSAGEATAFPDAFSRLIGCLAAALVAGLLFAPTAIADHGGPKVFVDIDNPASEDQDCNFHFKTLKAALTKCSLSENTIIVLDPGNYDEGQLTIDTKGTTIRPSGVAKQTRITGCFTVTAKNVQLQNLNVAADNCNVGVSVQDRSVKLHKLLVHDAKETGVIITGASDGTTVTDLQIFNNGKYGLHVTGVSLDLTLNDNSVVSNQGSGIVMEGNADRFTLSGNTANMNGGSGLHILGGDNGQITKNTFKTNEADGMRIEGTNGHTVVENTAKSNAQFGISVVKGSNNEIRANSLSNNEKGGLALRGANGHALGNTVENNTISNSNKDGTTGVLLSGDVTGNIILKNTIKTNYVGVRFASGGEDGTAPARNILDNNEITGSNSAGVRVDASAGLNQVIANTITGNTAAGIHVFGGKGNDTYSDNVIEDNGAEGIRVEDSADNAILNNDIKGNGGSSNDQGNDGDVAAIALTDTKATIVQANAIGAGEADGVRLVNAKNTRLLGNTIENRDGNGLRAAGVVQPFFEGNRIQNNRGRGLALTSTESATCTALDMQRNTITGNGLGGVFVSSCEGVHLQMNKIAENMRFGFWVEQSKRIQARYNWWGDPSGPSGVFAGQGNAVVFQGNDVAGGNSTGLPSDHILHAVVPWLTDQVGQQTEDSVNGYTLRDFGAASVDVDATAFAGISLAFHGVKPESKGVAILARYAQQVPSAGSIYAPIGLQNILRTVSVVVSGFGTDGQAVVEMIYNSDDIPEGVDESQMQLFALYGGEWHALQGGTLPDANMVEGSVKLSRLQEGALIAMAPAGNQQE